MNPACLEIYLFIRTKTQQTTAVTMPDLRVALSGKKSTLKTGNKPQGNVRFWVVGSITGLARTSFSKR